MTPTRRQVLATATASAAVASTLGPAALARGLAQEPEAKKLRVLILGGTGFLGPALIDAVVARGHHLTLFNSGTTEARREEAGRDSVVPEGVEVLIGNRDPELTADDRRLRNDPDAESKRDPNSPKGLTNLEGKEWDVVFDTSGYFPRIVRASAELLADQVKQYVFVSSISVYARNDVPWADESAEVGVLTEPELEEFGERFERYGPAKAACEAAAEKAMPGRVTNVRPGYIVGPRDTTRRFLYWPWRVLQGGAMIVPGAPEDPIQVIDVRDLAEWMVRCAETRTVGVFNATGPKEELSMAGMLEACCEGLELAEDARPERTWIPADFLAEHELAFPIWASPEGETQGFHRTSVKKAVAAGLTFRPMSDTAAACIEWWRSLPEAGRAGVLPPHDAEREAAVLKAWAER